MNKDIALYRLEVDIDFRRELARLYGVCILELESTDEYSTLRCLAVSRLSGLTLERLELLLKLWFDTPHIIFDFQPLSKCNLFEGDNVTPEGELVNQWLRDKKDAQRGVLAISDGVFKLSVV